MTGFVASQNDKIKEPRFCAGCKTIIRRGQRYVYENNSPYYPSRAFCIACGRNEINRYLDGG